MYIIRGLRNVPAEFRGAAVTIGNFDGVHLGHQGLFAQLRHLAAPDHLPTMAITFEPHPRHLLRPGDATPRITGIRGKARWMESHGIEAMFILRFTRELANQSAESFVRRFLVDGLAVRHLLVGYNFRFGRGGHGDIALLQGLGTEYGFTAHQQAAFLLDGAPISSTRVRQAVQERDFAAATTLLGHPFEVEGRVGGGAKRGRGLGFPTANLPLTGMLHPPPGVYVVAGWVGDAWLPGVANLGHNPTFGGDQLHLESHLLAPCGELYHRVLRIRFLHYLRDEITFASGKALVEQIGRDVEEARAFFAAYPEKLAE